VAHNVGLQQYYGHLRHEVPVRFSTPSHSIAAETKRSSTVICGTTCLRTSFRGENRRCGPVAKFRTVSVPRTETGRRSILVGLVFATVVMRPKLAGAEISATGLPDYVLFSRLKHSARNSKARRSAFRGPACGRLKLPFQNGVLTTGWPTREPVKFRSQTETPRHPDCSSRLPTPKGSC